MKAEESAYKISLLGLHLFCICLGLWGTNAKLELEVQKVCCCCLVAKSYPTLWDPMDCSTPGFSVLHHLPEFVQTHVCWVGDAS